MRSSQSWMLAGALLGLAPLAVAQASAPQGESWSVVRMVLQENRELMDKQVVGDLLQSNVFLASVAPGVVFAGPLGELDAMLAEARKGPLPAGRWPNVGLHHLYSAPITHAGGVYGVVLLTVDPKLASNLLEKVLHTLEDWVATEQQQAHEYVAASKTRLAAAEAAFAEAVNDLSMIGAEAGGLEPMEWLPVLRAQLQNAVQESFDVGSRTSVRRAIRAHLAERWEQMPRTIVVEGELQPNPHHVQLRTELNAVQAELEGIDMVGSSQPQRAQQITALRQRLLDLETRLSITNQRVRGPDQEVENPERRKLRRELVDAEEDLAKISAERAALDEAIATMRKEVLRYQQLAERFSTANRHRNEADSVRKDARKNQQRWEERLIKVKGPGVFVVSGPTVTSLP